MSIYLRPTSGKEVGRKDVGGRVVRLLETRHKGQLRSRALVAGPGAHTPRTEGASYRSTGQELVFDIDPIVIRPETKWDRAGKRLGLNLEASIGDADLDARLYFETKTKPEVVRELFSDAALRAALVAALAAFSIVVIGPPGGAVATVTAPNGSRMEHDLDDASRVGALVALADALPAIQARPPPSPLLMIVPNIIASVVIQLAGILAFFTVSTSNALVAPPVLLPCVIGLAVGVTFTFTALRWIYGRRGDGFRRWLVAAIGVTLTCIATGVIAFSALNGALDEAGPSRYEATVVSYQPYKRKKQSGQLLVKGLPASLVASESNGAQEIDYQWMPDEACKRIAFDIAPGRFGVPWVASATCAER